MRSSRVLAAMESVMYVQKRNGTIFDAQTGNVNVFVAKQRSSVKMFELVEDVRPRLLCGCRPWMACRASIRHPKGPLDSFEVHLANVGIIPRFFRVSQR